MRIYLKANQLNAVLHGTLPTSTPIGYRYNDEDDSYTAFVGTERLTGRVRYDAGKDQLLLVLKRSDRTKGPPMYLYTKPATLSAIVRGDLPTSTPVGFRYNASNQSFTAFVATDRETGHIHWSGKEGEEAIAINMRKSKKADEVTQAPFRSEDIPF